MYKMGLFQPLFHFHSRHIQQVQWLVQVLVSDALYKGCMVLPEVCVRVPQPHYPLAKGLRLGSLQGD